MAEALVAALAAALALAPVPAARPGPTAQAGRTDMSEGPGRTADPDPARPVPADSSSGAASPVPSDSFPEPVPFAVELPGAPSRAAQAGFAPAGPVPAAAPTAVEGPRPAPALAVVPAPAGVCHDSRPCKRLVVLAGVSGALGLATVIAGGVIAARPVRVDPDDPTMAIAYRPAGAAVLAIGVGLLTTSLLMGVAAARASRQAQKHGASGRVAGGSAGRGGRTAARWSAPPPRAMLPR